MKKSFWTKTPVIILAAFAANFLWGSAFPCIKIGYALFAIDSGDTASQLLFAGVRFTLAGLLVILFGSIAQKRPLLPERSSWKHIFALSSFQTVGQYIFFYIGLAYASGVKSSIIGGTNTFITILIAALVFRSEKLTARKILGCVIGFLGIVLIQLPGNTLDLSFQFRGEGFILISTVAAALSSGYIKKVSDRQDPVVLCGWQFVAGGLVLAVLGGALGGHLSFHSASCCILLLYMAFISAAAYTLWSLLLKHNPVSRVAVFWFINPVIGVMLSALLLHESNQAFSLYGLGALVLITIGILIVYRIKAEPGTSS